MELPDASLAYMDGLQQVSSMEFGQSKFVRLIYFNNRYLYILFTFGGILMLPYLLHFNKSSSFPLFLYKFINIYQYIIFLTPLFSSPLRPVLIFLALVLIGPSLPLMIPSLFSPPLLSLNQELNKSLRICRFLFRFRNFCVMYI